MHTPSTDLAPPRPVPTAHLDLEEEVRRTRAGLAAGGRYAKTLVHGDDMRLVLMVLDRGVALAEHHVRGSLTLQVLDGRVVVTLRGSSFDLGPGQLLAIERDAPYSLAASEGSAILLTLTWAAKPRPRSRATGELIVGGDWACAHGDCEGLRHVARRLADHVSEPLHCELAALAEACLCDPDRAIAEWLRLKQLVS